MKKNKLLLIAGIFLFSNSLYGLQIDLAKNMVETGQSIKKILKEQNKNFVIPFKDFKVILNGKDKQNRPICKAKYKDKIYFIKKIAEPYPGGSKHGRKEIKKIRTIAEKIASDLYEEFDVNVPKNYIVSDNERLYLASRLEHEESKRAWHTRIRA